MCAVTCPTAHNHTAPVPQQRNVGKQSNTPPRHYVYARAVADGQRYISKDGKASTL